MKLLSNLLKSCTCNEKFLFQSSLFAASDACAHVSAFKHHTIHLIIHADFAQVFVF